MIGVGPAASADSGALRIGGDIPVIDIPARVLELRYEAESVISVRFGTSQGLSLPDWSPGAHVDVVLPVGLVRQYSIIESDAGRAWYRVGILRDPASRGASEYVHLFLRPGQEICIRPPRNHFPLTAAAEYIFVAGGIGITPFIPMIDAVAAEGTPWHLHYAARSVSHMPFLDRVNRYGDSVTHWLSDIGCRLDLRQVVPRPRTGLLLYACGPQRLLEALQSATHELGWSADDVRVERFKASTRPATTENRPMIVRAQRSGQIIEVSADETVLTALARSGIGIASSCHNGLCGSCEVHVLAGQPDHRDDILTQAQREESDAMFVCVSRALSDQLVLDV